MHIYFRSNYISGLLFGLLLFVAFITSKCTHGNDNISSSNESDTSIGSQSEAIITKYSNVITYDSLDSPRFEIKFTREQVYRDNGFPQFSLGNQISVSNSGVLFIQHGVNIYSYNSEGNLIATMGGKGRGPGEMLGFAKKEMIIQADRLFVYDDMQYRINIYSADTFEPIGAINMDPQKLNSLSENNEKYIANTLLHVPLYYPSVDSLLLIRLNPNISNKLRQTSRSNSNRYVTLDIPTYFYLMNQKGKFVSGKVFDTKYKLKFLGGAAGGPPLPYDSRTIIQTGPQGNIYAANTQDFFIKMYDFRGNYKRAFFFKINKIPFNLTEFIPTATDNKTVREMIENSPLPDTWPVLADFFVDDMQRIWVATYTEDTNYYRWYLFEADGDYLATFKWPEHRSGLRLNSRSTIKTVKDDYLYAFQPTSKEEVGGNYVRFKIDFSKKNQP